MPSKSFQFVLSSGNTTTDDEHTRKVVRENAMRAFRRRERLARVREYQKTQANAYQRGQDAGTTHEPGPSAPNQEGLATSQSSEIDLIREPGNSFDPFASTVLPESHRGRELFQHFVNELAPRLQVTGDAPNSINIYISRFALSDSGLLATMLFHASLHQDSFTDKTEQSWGQDTLYYRGESIKEINRRLRTGHSVDNDSNIAMVGFLSGSANITGNVIAEESHRIAMRKMVDMRDGLDNLGQSGALAMLMAIGDIISSTIAGTVPVLPAPNLMQNHLCSSVSIPTCLSTQAQPPCTPTSYEAEVDTLMAFTRHVVDLQIVTLCSSRSNVRDATAFTQLSSAIEHRLLSLPTIPPDAEVGREMILVEAKKTAIQILCAYIFRGFRPPALNFHALSCRLQWLSGLLGHGHESVHHARSVEEKRLLLWIHIAHALASIPRDLEAPVMEIVGSMKQLGISSWEETKGTLAEFIWCARCEDEGCQRLWIHIQGSLVLEPQASVKDFD